jgi:hypothetical protein
LEEEQHLPVKDNKNHHHRLEACFLVRKPSVFDGHQEHKVLKILRKFWEWKKTIKP